MPQAAEGRILRSCDVCGQVDDHPRHVFATGGIEGLEQKVNADAVQAAYDTKGIDTRDLVRIVRELEDTTSFQRHMDCCRSAGCPSGDCNNAPTKTGHALVEAITGEKVL